MRSPDTANWIRLGLLALPLYGMLTFWSSLDPQPDPNTHYEAWSRYVTTDHYVLTHVFGSILGLILAIFGTFALGAFLTRSRAARLGLVAMIITVLGSALFLPAGDGGLHLLCARGGAGLLGRHRGARRAAHLFRRHRVHGDLPASRRAAVCWQRAAGGGGLALGDTAQVGRSPVGCRAGVHVPLGPGVCGDDRACEHPADGAGGRVVGGGRRGVDSLEGDAPAFYPEGRG
jgi:hypothetical protein